jgi:hypothetical protein
VLAPRQGRNSGRRAHTDWNFAGGANHPGGDRYRETKMTNDSTVHHLAAVDLVAGAAAALKHRRRRPSLVSTLKAARKAGAGQVELIDNKVVISLAGETENDAGCSADRNEWDEILPGGGHGEH